MDQKEAGSWEGEAGFAWCLESGGAKVEWDLLDRGHALDWGRGHAAELVM